MQIYPAEDAHAGLQHGRGGHPAILTTDLPTEDPGGDTRDSLLDLQRQLLPAGLPVMPSVRLTAHYLPGQDEHRAGGDWFDAFALPDGSIALAVGDVAGHGPAASAAMAQLRAVLREALLADPRPAEALARLGRFAGFAPETRGASACVVVLNPANGAARYACAGHPRPLVCSSDGSARFLDDAHGGPLGVAADPPTNCTATLELGSVLVIYSDGLIEKQGQAPGSRLRDLAGVAGAAVRSARSDADGDAAERVCSAAIDELSRAGHADDVTVIAAHRLGRPAPGWSLSLPAEPGQLSTLRQSLGDWLLGLGVGIDDVIDLELAVYEAAANAVVHGRPERGHAAVAARANLDGRGGVRISISDQGSWEPENGPHLSGNSGGGRGLSIITRLTDEMDIAAGPGGTTVTLGRRVSHPVVLGGAEPSPDRERSGDSALTTTVTQASPATLDVRGPVDSSTIGALVGAIMRASAGGSIPLTVDLSGATSLSADALRDLRDLVAAPGTAGRSPASWLRLAAAPDSLARYVLALAGLDGELAA